jgi:large subunit ribosomal protein L15
MRLNTIAPAQGSKKARVRVGRGIGSGLGKTCGKGHKGQKARAGGYHKVGFEGGQMPLQRRLPKFGFYSHLKTETAEVRLHELAVIAIEGPITLGVLKDVGLVGRNIKYAKVFLKGTIDKAVHLKGIGVTKGARALIEAAGGRVEE